MKEIKIYLEYPWKFADSPYYKYLLRYPPKNVKYLNDPKKYTLLPPTNMRMKNE